GGSSYTLIISWRGGGCVNGVASQVSIDRADRRRRQRLLRSLEPPNLGADLSVRLAALSIQLTNVDRQRPGRRAVDRLIECSNRPGTGERRGARRQPHGIAGVHEGFAGDATGHFVLPVVIRAVRREKRDHDLRPKGANRRHDVPEQGIVRPGRERNGIIARVAEIVGAGEVLMRAIALSFGEQLGGAHHAEERSALVADQVDAVLSARERQIRRLDVPAEGEPRDQRVVFIVGVGADDHDAGDGAGGGGLGAPWRVDGYDRDLRTQRRGENRERGTGRERDEPAGRGGHTKTIVETQPIGKQGLPGLRERGGPTVAAQVTGATPADSSEPSARPPRPSPCRRRGMTSCPNRRHSSRCGYPDNMKVLMPSA